MQEIRVIDVNRRTREKFRAPDKATLLTRLDEVFRDEMRTPFAEQLIDLWHGKLMQHREVVNYGLDGELINVLLQFSVLPGAERDWSLVQVALIDITARKKAEAYLEYLGKHDVLTGLRYRAYFEDEFNRLDRKGPWPVTVIAVDLTKPAQGGQRPQRPCRRRRAAAPRRRGARQGDRQAGLRRAHRRRRVRPAAARRRRCGGPADDRAHPVDGRSQQPVLPGAPLSLAMGCASALRAERLETTVSRADERMFEAKRAFYARCGHDRRNTSPADLE
jgi:hypothetical protein